MKVLLQKPLEIKNTCAARYDEQGLINAILWYTDRPVCRMKSVYMHGRYPAVSIYEQKIHIHRLLYMYWNKQDLDRGQHIHHINGNRLDATKENLSLIDSSTHMRFHNKGKKLSPEHRRKIGEANRRRKGMKMKRRVDIPIYELHDLVNSGHSINAIAKHFGCDWSTIKDRIYENPELLEPRA